MVAWDLDKPRLHQRGRTGPRPAVELHANHEKIKVWRKKVKLDGPITPPATKVGKGKEMVDGSRVFYFLL